MKPKKCKECLNIFTPSRPLQQVCSPQCAYKKAKADQEKKEVKQWKERKKEAKEKLKTLSDWKKDLEREVNGIVRILDKGMTCISCTGEGKEQAGHYHSVGANDSIRFNLHNIHKQCYHCNVPKGSNTIMYDNGLINTYGEKYWEMVKFDLVRQYPLIKLSVDEIKEAIGKAREVRRSLEKANVTYPAKVRVHLRNKFNERLGIYTVSQ